MTLNAELPLTAADITWPVKYARGGCSAFDVEGLEPEEAAEVAAEQHDFELQAIEMLWAFTKRVFGTRESVVRPVRVDPRQRSSTFEGLGPHSAYYEMGVPGVGYGWVSPMVAGAWQALSCGVCGRLTCECDRGILRSLNLPGPVQEIVSVQIDGETLPSTAYRVDRKRALVRTDGESWPAQQDTLRALTEQGTWGVTFVHGLEVPVGGQYAAGRLACELAKSAQGDESCQLPSRVQSVSRQGVTVDILGEFDGLEKGQLGIWEIDSWIASVNQPRTFVGITSPESRLKPRYRL